MAVTALITGASGLIGRSVLKNWDVSGIAPVVLDRGSYDLLGPDAAEVALRRLRPAIVIHLAWEASGTPGYRTSTDNDLWVDASLRLAEACRSSGAWFIATGSSLDSAGMTGDAYTAAKSRLRQALSSEIDAGQMTWLRPYYVLDLERRRPALVDQALAARASGRTLELQTPQSQHDFVHVDDTARAIMLAARERLPGELPIGSGHLRRVRDLIDALGVSWTPGRPPDAFVPHLHDAANVTRLLERGWSPTSTEELFSSA